MGWFSPNSFSQSLPQRDRVAILAALVGVTALAWAYVIYLWAQRPAMDMNAPGAMMQMHPWTPADFVFMFLMWAIMMVGMMLPSANSGSGPIDGGGSVSTHAVEECLLRLLPVTSALYFASLAVWGEWCIPVGFGARRVLLGLLLGVDGALVFRRGHESALDRRNCNFCFS